MLLSVFKSFHESIFFGIFWLLLMAVTTWSCFACDIHLLLSIKMCMLENISCFGVSSLQGVKDVYTFSVLFSSISQSVDLFV